MEKECYTFEDLIESEKNMVLQASEKYGEFWGNSFGLVAFINRFVKSVDDPSKFIFLAFWSQVKKHLTLALFSAVRRHHVQSKMDMRQVLEAASWAAYALAFKDESKFYEKDEYGNIQVTDRLKKEKNKWLNQNFKIKSEEIKRNIKMIGDSTAHANIAYAFNNFHMKTENNPGFVLPFFDQEDDYIVKTDLWSIANTAIGLVGLFIGVNQQYKVFRLIDDFNDQFKQLVDLNKKLQLEMMTNKRYKDVLNRRETT